MPQTVRLAHHAIRDKRPSGSLVFGLLALALPGSECEGRPTFTSYLSVRNFGGPQLSEHKVLLRLHSLDEVVRSLQTSPPAISSG